MPKQKYTVLSPDGFNIRFENEWNTKEEAQQALTKWMERYEAQGYYSSNEGRIPLHELESRCVIKLI